MKVTTERIPDNQMLLNIEIDDEELETHKNRAYRRLVQSANIPGFRKGKAPRRILEQYLAPGALVQEALESLLPETTAKAIEEQGIEAAGEPSIEVDDEELVNDKVVIKATVPLQPTVDLGNYQSIRIPWDAPDVTEEDITQVLDRMQQETAPWEPIERPVEMGDMVTLHIQAWATGLAPVDSEEAAEGETPDEESTPAEPTTAESAATKAEGDEEAERQFMNEDDWTYYPRPESTFPAPGFADKLLGMTKDESREFTIKMPDDYSIPDLAGRETRFAVTLKEMKGQELGERDDEWAKGIGEGYDSFDALREKVVKDLSERKEQEVKLAYENEVLEKVIEGASIEFAPVLIDHELQHLMNDRAERLRSMGIELNDYLSMSDRTIQDMAEEVKPDAERRVTNTLVLNQLVENEKIEIGDADVDEEIKRVTGVEEEDATPEQTEQVQKLMESEETRESIRRSLTHRAAMDRLVEMARSDAPVATVEESSTEDETPEDSDADAEETTPEDATAEGSDSDATTEDSSENDN